MAQLTSIGLNITQSEALTKQLNTLLSSYQIQYMNARGFHWNIKGRQFFELHLKFEEIYNDLLLKVDEVAERILTLGGQPKHAYSEYMSLSNISEAQGISDGATAVNNLLAGFEQLISHQRIILAQASEASDEGTASLMSDYIKEQEKLIWMLKAYLA